MNTSDMAMVTGAMLALGYVMKNLLPVDNKWIPLILLVLGTAIYCTWTGHWDGRSIITGIMAAASATGLHQATIRTIEPTKPNTNGPKDQSGGGGSAG